LVPAATVVVEFVAPSIAVTVPALTQSPWLATYLVGQQVDRHGKRFVPGATDAVEFGGSVNHCDVAAAEIRDVDFVSRGVDTQAPGIGSDHDRGGVSGSINYSDSRGAPWAA